MRVLRLNLAGHRADFHRYVAVVRVKDDALRSKLIETLRALPTGRVDGVTGIVEAYGVLLDLTPENLALLDIPDGAVESVDPVVTPEQLPAGGLDPTIVARRNAERRRAAVRDRLELLEINAERAAISLTAARDALAEGERTGFTSAVGAASATAVEGPRAELARLVAARIEADEAREAASVAYEAAEAARAAEAQRVATATAQSEQAVERSATAASELEKTTATSDPAARAALEAARQRLAELEPERPTPEPRVEIAPIGAISNQHSGAEDVDERVERLVARRRELEAELMAVETVDPLPVRVALRSAQSEREPELVPSTEALRLADEWVRINSALAEQPVPPDDDPRQYAIVECRVRVENARAALADAERAARLPDVDRTDIEALEDAHEKVLEAHDKVERRLGRSRAQTRLDEARQEEQAILDRMGFLTYADFRMGTSLVHIDSAIEDRLEAARTELANAEDALATAEAGIAEELARAELLSQRSQVRAAALMILGDDPGDGLELALRQHRIAKRETGERIQRLRGALDAAGLDLRNDDVSDQLLFEFATTWLDEQEETIAQRLEISQRIAEVSAEIEAAKAPPEQPPHVSGTEVADDEDEAANDEAAAAEARAAAIDEARRAVAAAEERVARQAEVDLDAEQRQAALFGAADNEQGAATELAAAEAALFAAEQVERDAAATLAAAVEAATAAQSAEQAASADLNAVTERLAATAAVEGRAALERAVTTAERSAAEADAALARSRAELAAIEATLAELEEDAMAPTPAHAAGSPTDSLEELEWYLLARIAAQRSVSYAGSVPLVLDDALLGLDGVALAHILGRLERMTSAVQIVVITTESDAAAWATEAGPERAMAVDLT